MPLFDSNISVAQEPIRSRLQQRNIPASPTAAVVLAANTGRVGVMLLNASNATLCLGVSTAVSRNNCIVRLPPNAYYELPFSPVDRLFGIWSAGEGVDVTGTLCVHEAVAIEAD